LFFVVPHARGIALGVGGALTLLGLAAVANGLLLASDEVPQPYRKRKDG